MHMHIRSLHGRLQALAGMHAHRQRTCSPDLLSTQRCPPNAAPPLLCQVAGLGDALATWFEARSCSESHSHNVLGGAATLSGVALAHLCYKTLLADAEAACAAVEVCGGRGALQAARLWLCHIWHQQSRPLASFPCRHHSLNATQAKAVTPALERIVEANTLLSGLGFESAVRGVEAASPAGNAVRLQVCHAQLLSLLLCCCRASAWRTQCTMG